MPVEQAFLSAPYPLVFKDVHSFPSWEINFPRMGRNRKRIENLGKQLKEAIF